MKNQTILLGIKIDTPYGVLRDSYVNFHPEIQIKFNNHNEIHITRSSKYLKGFFGPRVSTLTGIVGQNGVGKTTTLNYIKDLFLKERNELRHRERDLIFFLDAGIIKIYLNADEKGRYQVYNNTGLSTEEIFYRDYPKVYDRIKNLTTVYYSNSLDLDNREIETTNFYNLSTSFLLTSVGKVNRHLKNRRIKYQTSTRRFKFTEFRRQVDFLNFIKSSTDLDIPFKRFEFIEIEIKEVSKKDYEKLCLNVRKYIKAAGDIAPAAIEELEHLEEVIKELRTKFSFRKDSLQPALGYVGSKDSSEFLIIENYTILLLKYITDSNAILTYYASNSDFLRELIRRISEFEVGYIRDPQEHIARLYFELKEVIDKEREYNNRRDGERESKELLKLSEKFEDIVGDQEKLFKILEYTHQGPRLQIDLQTVNIGSLLEKYYSAYNSEFFFFKWPRLSAGEESLISFFSRVNVVLNDVKSENILILIDEGDLYFHPEWQRKYLYYVLSYLNLQESVQHIQVILTTHSPFLVSDLPFENLIILDSLENTKLLEDEHFETFGGNIYSLYSKTFFLGGSTISEFAKRKIKNEIIDELNQSNTPEEKEKISLLIDKVGEPVLKEMLRKKLNKVY